MPETVSKEQRNPKLMTDVNLNNRLECKCCWIEKLTVEVRNSALKTPLMGQVHTVPFRAPGLRIEKIFSIQKNLTLIFCI